MSSFCKVCFETGKEESVYKSHFVRSWDGVKSCVVCPTLLATVCRGCQQKGHTINYCSVLKEKEKQKEKQKNRDRYINTRPALANEKHGAKSKFYNLYQSDDEDEVKSVKEEVKIVKEEVKIVKEEVKIVKEEVKIVKHELSGWAAIAAAQPTVPVRAPVPVTVPVTVTVPVRAPTVVQKIMRCKNPKNLRSWADWSDSDDETSDEEE